MLILAETVGISDSLRGGVGGGGGGEGMLTVAEYAVTGLVYELAVDVEDEADVYRAWAEGTKKHSCGHYGMHHGKLLAPCGLVVLYMFEYADVCCPMRGKVALLAGKPSVSRNRGWALPPSTVSLISTIVCLHE